MFVIFSWSVNRRGNMFESCLRFAGCICIRFSQKSNIFCPFRPQISQLRTIYHGWRQLSDTVSALWASILYVRFFWSVIFELYKFICAILLLYVYLIKKKNYPTVNGLCLTPLKKPLNILLSAPEILYGD